MKARYRMMHVFRNSWELIPMNNCARGLQAAGVIRFLTEAFR